MCDYIISNILDSIEDFLVDSFYTQESKEEAKEMYNAICEKIRKKDFTDRVIEKVTETYNEYLTDNDYLNNLCAKIARAERMKND